MSQTWKMANTGNSPFSWGNQGQGDLPGRANTCHLCAPSQGSRLRVLLKDSVQRRHAFFKINSPVVVSFMCQLDQPWPAQMKHYLGVCVWGCFWMRRALNRWTQIFCIFLSFLQWKHDRSSSPNSPSVCVWHNFASTSWKFLEHTFVFLEYEMVFMKGIFLFIILHIVLSSFQAWSRIWL